MNDPGETQNIVDGDEHAARVVDMKGRLEGWFVKYVKPEFDGTHEPVTGKGQLDLAGPAGEGKPAFAGDWYYLSGDESPGTPSGPSGGARRSVPPSGRARRRRKRPGYGPPPIR